MNKPKVSLQHMVITYLTKNPGATSSQVGEAFAKAGLNRTSSSPTISQLVAEGKVIREKVNGEKSTHRLAPETAVVVPTETTKVKRTTFKSRIAGAKASRKTKLMAQEILEKSTIGEINELINELRNSIGSAFGFKI